MKSVWRNWAFCIATLCTVRFADAKKTGSEDAARADIIEIDFAARNALKEVSVYSNLLSQVGQRHDNVKSLIPDGRYCGLQHTDDRIYEETSTALDEFPWLVDVVHQDNVSICLGVLINNRYVLTGYGCSLFSNKVRLGLYNTRQTVACVEGSAISECSDPVVEIKVEKRMYTNIKGDIALLRLIKNAEYSDYIRPICLPLDESVRPGKGSTLIASGWGKNVEDGAGSTKKRLKFTLRSASECRTLDPEVQASLDQDEFCFTSVESRSDVGCIDDYGGPIMYTHKHQWFLEGILIGPYTRNKAFGYCSESVKPIYGKKITNEIISWVFDTVQP